uniref:Miff domain-containing protein n=1 Tax=Panagrellus redivivus TaxID=6233 RepID=A0A7E4VK18_PANRE
MDNSDVSRKGTMKRRIFVGEDKHRPRAQRFNETRARAQKSRQTIHLLKRSNQMGHDLDSESMAANGNDVQHTCAADMAIRPSFAIGRNAYYWASSMAEQEEKQREAARKAAAGTASNADPSESQKRLTPSRHGIPTPATSPRTNLTTSPEPIPETSPTAPLMEYRMPSGIATVSTVPNTFSVEKNAHPMGHFMYAELSQVDGSEFTHILAVTSQKRSVYSVNLPTNAQIMCFHVHPTLPCHSTNDCTCETLMAYTKGQKRLLLRRRRPNLINSS